MASGRQHPVNPGGLDLGFSVLDGQTTAAHYGLAQTKRMEHVAILGKTGTGKSTLLRYMARQDIERGRGFCFFAPTRSLGGSTGLDYSTDLDCSFAWRDWRPFGLRIELRVFAPAFPLKKRRGKFVRWLSGCETIGSRIVGSVGVVTASAPTN